MEMRTTIELAPELHTLARELAHQQNKTMSQVINQLVRLGLRPVDSTVCADSDAVFPSVRIGRLITAEDVRSLED